MRACNLLRQLRVPSDTQAPKADRKNFRSAHSACAPIGTERGLCPLYSELTLTKQPAPAPHRQKRGKNK
ncbi:hypothetical protein NDU88_009964 [Pleurodeles waltl]|uniref:Uncharacterized protein n=1 Tax=Pleurodeles waltl TaxID=8319 RepID=A0AAV7PXG1_PLEWA|nr:hypothetical protein NDU88_009964 [Pleurodeles waltl]